MLIFNFLIGLLFYVGIGYFLYKEDNNLIGFVYGGVDVGFML